MTEHQHETPTQDKEHIMSSGFAGIASIAIENGSVSITEGCGDYAPRVDKPFDLTVHWTEPGEADGNLHGEPQERGATVYLSWQEMIELAETLAAWVPGLRKHYEGQDREHAEWQQHDADRKRRVAEVEQQCRDEWNAAHGIARFRPHVLDGAEPGRKA